MPGAGGPTGLPRPRLSVANPEYNEIRTVRMVLKGINRGTRANTELAFTVQHFLTNSPSFTNAVLGDPRNDVDTNTFTFEVTADLRNHFKL